MSALSCFTEIRFTENTFIETVSFLHQPYVVRAIGGLFFVAGMVLMTINAFMTIRKSRREQAELEAKLAAKMAQA